MKTQKNILLQLFVLVFITTMGMAQGDVSNYILFDAQCMKKHDYRVSGTYPDVSFFDYYVPLGNGTTAVLRSPQMEIYEDLESALDKEPWHCDDVSKITPNFIEDINGVRKVLFMVEKKSDKLFIVRRITKVLTITETNTSIAYRDYIDDFSYQYNAYYEPQERNLSNRKEQGCKVYYKARTQSNCLYTRAFEAISEHTEDPVKTYRFTEKIGLYTINIQGGEVRLMSINGIPYEEYLAKTCANQKAPNFGTAEGGGTVTPPAPPVNPYANTGGGNTPPPNANGNNGGSHGGIFDPDHQSTQVLDVHKEYHIDTLIPNIPALPQGSKVTLGMHGKFDGRIYYVKQGDNLYIIAQAFDLTTQEIQCLNNMPDYKITPGDALLVVDETGACKARGENPQLRYDNTNRIVTYVHVVRQGENLGRIAAKYGMKVEELYPLNPMLVNPDAIQIDQEIIVKRQNF